MITVKEYIDELNDLEQVARKRVDKTELLILSKDNCKAVARSLKLNLKLHNKTLSQVRSDIEDMCDYEDKYGSDKQADEGFHFLASIKTRRLARGRGCYFVDNTGPSTAQAAGFEDSDFEFYHG